MTEKELLENAVRQKMQEGLDAINPIVEKITELVMDAYQEGFKTAFELFTGEKFDKV